MTSKVAKLNIKPNILITLKYPLEKTQHNPQIINYNE